MRDALSTLPRSQIQHWKREGIVDSKRGRLAVQELEKLIAKCHDVDRGHGPRDP